MSWEQNWAAVQAAVYESETRGQAVARASAALGRSITWDALQRAWKRYTSESILNALGNVAADSRAHTYNDVAANDEEDSLPAERPRPWYTAPRSYTLQTAARILVIPDTQCMPGAPDSHFTALGRYAVAKRPDFIIHLGDFRDMPSLSSYESAARKAHEGRCKVADIEAGNRAIELFETELAKAQGYAPTKIMLEGNHDGWNEHGRIGRYLADHPDDRALFEKVPMLEKQLGWEVVPFLEPVEVQGTLYCHLFPFSAKGTVTAGSLRMGASSASAQVKSVMQSCTAGHKQGLDVAIHNTPVNTYRALIAGSCYQHTDGYMPGARFWRGCVLKNGAKDGNYSLVEVPLDWLLKRHG